MRRLRCAEAVFFLIYTLYLPCSAASQNDPDACLAQLLAQGWNQIPGTGDPVASVKHSVGATYESYRLTEVDPRLASISVLAFSKSLERVAATDNAGNLLVIEVRAQKIIWSHPYTMEVKTLAFSPDGADLAVGLENGNVEIWNYDSGIIHANFSIPLSFFEAATPSLSPKKRKAVSSLAYSADGSGVVVGYVAGLVLFYDLASRKSVRFQLPRTKESLKLIQGLDPNFRRIREVAISPDGSLISALRREYTRKLRFPLDRTFGYQIMLYHDDSQKLAGAIADQFQATLVRQCYIWRRETGELIDTCESSNVGKSGQDEFTGLAFSPDGQTLAIANASRRLPEISSKLIQRTPFASPSEKKWDLTAYPIRISFNHRGDQIVSLSYDRWIGIQDLKSGRLTGLFSFASDRVLRREPDGEIRWLGVSTTENQLVVCSKDGRLTYLRWEQR